MLWFRRTERGIPSFDGPNGAIIAVNHHFKFIRMDSHPFIAFFIDKILKLVPMESKKIESYGGNRFKVGEIGFYPKEGNLHLLGSKELISKSKEVADKIFNDTEMLKPDPYDDDYLLIIHLQKLGWH